MRGGFRLYNVAAGSRQPHLRLGLTSEAFFVSSLYRKWRSRSFDDLLGQDHVVRTLRNAVQSGRVGHAYLFTGPRGTGKTSSARILAKAVNCLAPESGNPCNRCEMCRAADEGRALDVIEIDAASNTSVDNVRELRERVAYAAGEGRYKVYIVDEVHRLSGAAFDAFLKTLEEPPEHVIFVFASTEPHKVPATIMSRCQRFDFRRITPEVASGRLRYVADQEQLDVSDTALHLLVQAGNGSLRDSLGLLDQVASYSDGRIADEDVRRALGLTDPTLVARLTDDLVDGKVGDGLLEVSRFLDAGGDPGQLTRQFTEYWRALLLRAAGAPDADLLDPVLQERVASHAARIDQARIVAVLRAMTGTDFSSRFNLPAELPFEVGYVEAAVALSAPPRETAVVRTEEPAPPPPRAQAAAVPSPTRAQPSPPTNGSTRDSTYQPSAQTHSDLADLDGMWSTIVSNMRSRSRSLEALLKSAYLLKASDGEMTVGCLYRFHHEQLAVPERRRLLEQVVAETVGASYRVRPVLTTKDEIEQVRGQVVPEDDGFIEEAAERLRQMHVRQLGNGHS
jgi:DNA polymerase-3 subunit gamma/tau